MLTNILRYMVTVKDTLVSNHYGQSQTGKKCIYNDDDNMFAENLMESIKNFSQKSFQNGLLKNVSWC